MSSGNSFVTARDRLAALFRDGPVFEPGTVWLVGAGPGDPGLLTLHALSALAQADVIVHDALVDARVLALGRDGVEIEPAGKRGGRESATQADITQRLVDLARSNRRVLRLKGGDPFVFGRGGEEIQRLAREGVPFRVIPGLTAGLAALTVASIPATLRGVNQAVILATGHGADDADGMDWAALARTGQPIVLYMAKRTVSRVAAALIAGGCSPEIPAAAIASATLPGERVLVSTLTRLAGDIERVGLDAPLLVVIGAVVAARDELKALAAQVAGAGV